MPSQTYMYVAYMVVVVDAGLVSSPKWLYNDVLEAKPQELFNARKTTAESTMVV